MNAATEKFVAACTWLTQAEADPAVTDDDYNAKLAEMREARNAVPMAEIATLGLSGKIHPRFAH